jgi:hypothetical protein
MRTKMKTFNRLEDKVKVISWIMEQKDKKKRI